MMNTVNRFKRAALLSTSAVMLLAASFGCGPSQINYAGQNAQLASGVQVVFQEAFAKDDIFVVHMAVTNLSQAFLIVDRDGFALRLPDGRVLPRAIGTFTQHTPYTIPPGGVHQVNVDFRDAPRDMRQITGASLIVGGISFSTDPRPRVVGEVPLVPNGSR